MVTSQKFQQMADRI